jgi:hypothetical protein
MIKKFKSLSIFLVSYMLFSSLFFCFAYYATPDAPPLTSIVPIIGRILNIAVGVSGVALVAMIAYGVWKSSLATGDPRGLEGAKQTWSYALYGFFIIVGAYAAIVIISSLLGVGVSPGGFLGNISSALNSLLHPY